MNKIKFVTAFILTACQCFAQQTDIRVNPELGDEVSCSDISATDYKDYPFLSLADNHIKLNGANWSRLKTAFDNSKSSVVSVLHIGDSHIQAEGSTSRTRYRLQERFGRAGRGLTVPLRIAGTNAPMDYKIASECNFRTSRLLKTPYDTQPGFTGVAVEPLTEVFDISISCGDAFDNLCIFATGESSVEVDSASPDVLAGVLSASAGLTDVLLTKPVSSLTLRMRTVPGTAITAIELMHGNHGVEYSAIGNNGATYAHYDALEGFAENTRHMHPDLIIISLGTNEAFGRVSDDELRMHIESLINKLRMYNPDATMLLTTPQECYRRSRTRQRKRRSSSYAINPNINRMRNIITEYGVKNHIAVYDWYAASGGCGSASEWLSHRMMNTDRVHLTWDGYHIMGDMLADALLEKLATIQPNKDKTAGDESAIRHK